MPSCCAFGCTNSKSKNTCRNKTFFSFPLKNPGLVKEWLVRIRRDGFMPSSHSVICSDHFEEDCFLYQPFTNRRHLKPNTVPSKFVFSKENKPGRRLKKNCLQSTSTQGDVSNSAEYSTDPRTKLIAEMQAKGLTIEGIQVAGSSSSEQEMVVPDVDMQPGTSSSTGIFIKQEIIETEEEEIPNLLYSELATTSEGISSHENPTSVPTTSAAFHSQETLSMHISSPTKSDHQKSTDQQAQSASSAEGPVDESEKLISNCISYTRLRDEFDVFGDLIAVELRNMDAHMSNIVQKLVTDIVHEVKLGKRLTDEEKTNFALKRDDFIKRISSLDKSNPVNFPDVEGKVETIPDIPMADFISDTSPSIVAPEKRKDTVSVPICVSNPQELVTNILSSSENVAKYDHQKSTVQLSQPIERMASIHQSSENERSKLKMNRLDAADEPTRVSKIARIDKSSDSFALIRTRRNQNDIFGEFVVIELKKMDAITNSLVQKIIRELIFEAKVGICLTSEKKNILGLKSYIFINRLHSADKNLNNEINCSSDKTNQNLTPT